MGDFDFFDRLIRQRPGGDAEEEDVPIDQTIHACYQCKTMFIVEDLTSRKKYCSPTCAKTAERRKEKKRRKQKKYNPHRVNRTLETKKKDLPEWAVMPFESAQASKMDVRPLKGLPREWFSDHKAYEAQLEEFSKRAVMGSREDQGLPEHKGRGSERVLRTPEETQGVSKSLAAYAALISSQKPEGPNEGCTTGADGEPPVPPINVSASESATEWLSKNPQWWKADPLGRPEIKRPWPYVGVHCRGVVVKDFTEGTREQARMAAMAVARSLGIEPYSHLVKVA